MRRLLVFVVFSAGVECKEVEPALNATQYGRADDVASNAGFNKHHEEGAGQESAADKERIASLQAENQKLKKLVGEETDREFDGQDPKKHDHSRDHRKGRQHAEDEAFQQMSRHTRSQEHFGGPPVLPAHSHIARHGLLMGGAGLAEHWRKFLKVVTVLLLILVVIAFVAAAVGGLLKVSMRSLLRKEKGQQVLEQCGQRLLNGSPLAAPTVAAEGPVSQNIVDSLNAEAPAATTTVGCSTSANAASTVITDDSQSGPASSSVPQVLGATVLGAGCQLAADS